MMIALLKMQMIHFMDEWDEPASFSAAMASNFTRTRDAQAASFQNYDAQLRQ